MNSDLFKQILLYIDNHPKVLPNSLLLIDNYGAHVMEPAFLDFLSKIKVAFLPPNCTSQFQPLDAGLFYSAKCWYRKLYINHHMRSLDPLALDILTRQGINQDVSDEDIQLFKDSLFNSIQTSSPSNFELAKFISEAWDSIDNNIIMRAWIRADCLPDDAKRASIQHLILNENSNAALKAANTRLFNKLNIRREEFNNPLSNLPIPPTPSFAIPEFDFNDEYTAQQEMTLNINGVNSLYDGFLD